MPPKVWVECGPADPAIRRGMIIDHHFPGDPGYGFPPDRYWAGSSIGQVCNYLRVEPNERLMIIAAADHCLGAAYRGLCPDVDPTMLRRWRSQSRAAWRRLSVDKFTHEVDLAIEAVRGLPMIEVGGHLFADATDREISELSEASAISGIPVMYALHDTRSGRNKAGALNGTPEAMTAWLNWAFANLRDAYGDPHRGFAGGYLN